MYRIGQFAKLTGVTERTLRYYDKKGLLEPSLRDESGYRHYSKQDLFRLQKILTMKYLNFSLEDIAARLKDDAVPFSEVLNQQLEWLVQKRQELDSIIGKLDYMKKISSEGEAVSDELLLGMIYGLQNEDKLRAHLLEHLPNQYVKAVFLDHKDNEERLTIEKRIAVLITQIIEKYKSGITYENDEDVTSLGLQLYDTIAKVTIEAMSDMSEEEKQLMYQFEENKTQLDPAIFPDILQEDEHLYLDKLLEHVEDMYLQQHPELMSEDDTDRIADTTMNREEEA